MIRELRTAVVLSLVAVPLVFSSVGEAVIIFCAWLLPALFSHFKPCTPQRKVAWERFQRTSVAFLVMAVLINGTFGGGERKFGGPIGSLSIDGLEFGLDTGLRLILVSTAAILYILPLSSFEIADRLRRWRLPWGIPTAFLLAMQSLEQLPSHVENIRDAQSSRGLLVRGSMRHSFQGLRLLIAPLILRSISASLDRAVGFQLRRLHEGNASLQTKAHIQSKTVSVSSVLMTLIVWTFILYGILTWIGLLPSIT